MFILMFIFVVFCSMSEHGVIGVLCSDQQGLALSGQFITLMFIEYICRHEKELVKLHVCVVNADLIQFEVV